ncbi:MAG: peptide deformylase [Patescibacteria group bacterium]|nr:peptide deformylase [Patescibacteria group bacterium]MCL5261753.1 peptide deformylase [Patescibacteria group bacterium]
MKIVTIQDKKEEAKILHGRVPDFDFKKADRKAISEVIKKMRKIMQDSKGVGLSANQIGLNWRMFVAQNEGKFYTVFNPKITAASKETDECEEGCLSVPEMEKNIRRSYQVTLVGFDKNGKKLKIKAWGLLARIFQHETDHLNGRLIADHKE